MTETDEFEFLDPGPLRDGALTVVLVQTHPADLVKGWAPSYEFKLRIDEAEKPVGHLNPTSPALKENRGDRKLFGGLGGVIST